MATKKKVKTPAKETKSKPKTAVKTAKAKQKSFDEDFKGFEVAKTKKEVHQEKPKKKKMSEKTKNFIYTMVLASLLIFSVFKMGVLGTMLNNLATYIFGSAYYLSLLLIIAYFLFAERIKKETEYSIGLLLILCIIFVSYVTAIFSATTPDMQSFLAYLKQFEEYPRINGGIIGNFFYALLFSLTKLPGTIITAVILFFAIVAILYDIYFNETQNEEDEVIIKKPERKEVKQPVKHGVEFFTANSSNKDVAPVHAKSDETFVNKAGAPKKKKQKESFNSLIVDTNKSTKTKEKEDTSIVKGTKDYEFPPLSLLEEPKDVDMEANGVAADWKGQRIIEILKTFDIEASLIKTSIGPSVTKFEIRPKENVKIGKIQSVADNLKMELAAKTLRIEAPIPGRTAVGIEIPNEVSIPVRMKNLILEMPSKERNNPLCYALGKDLTGKNIYMSLDKYLHTLISGATGSGKSVCINGLIVSLLMKTSPDDVKLVLVDPKKVEFTQYKEIPHLMFPVITDTKMAVAMMKKITIIMDQRYELMSESSSRNIQSYNDYVEAYNDNLKEDEKPLEKMPYIVVIIDELADLMAVAGKDVELYIQRITQLARAAGIYLILATQRPSTDVITGLIKSNMPSRIAFAVASSIDSRTILDSTGAENLLGKGDMLVSEQGASSLVRVQGVYVSDSEIEKVTEFAKKQRKPDYDDSYFEIENNYASFGNESMNTSEKDEMYDEVIEFIRETQKASTSLLQRRFGIGYNRAARIIDQLEEDGLIGPTNGSKPREVYIKPEEQAE